MKGHVCAANAEKSVCIVTPVYRFPLPADEEDSLSILRSVLGSFDRFFIIPKGLSIPDAFRGDERIVEFSEAYFSYPHGYNRMLLRTEFYETFSGYDFMLIYQLDCIVFRDELMEWVDRGWDYVGSPWFIDSDKHRHDRPCSVGNGGFSLRKIATALTLLSQPIKRGILYPKPPVIAPQPSGFSWLFWNLRRRIRQHLGLWRVTDELENFFENEDIFWSFVAPTLFPVYRKPGVEEALAFGMEEKPRLCVKANRDSVPFGCHAWTKHDAPYVRALAAKLIRSES